MPRSRKINLEKVRASLDAVCPKCGKLVPPAEVRRIDFERNECPVCGERFVPATREAELFRGCR
jgi:ribosomal protein S27AE